MRALSVAERELRVAAQQPETHRLRWVTAAVFLLVLVWMLWVYRDANRQTAGPQLVQSMTVLACVVCLFVGTARTADCVSSERREGTLGLLFLTNLNSAEIVAGKFCSHALATVYALLAIGPVLALPLLLGGVTLEHFWRAVLGLLNVLCFALVCGFVASVICQRQYFALALALAMAIAGAVTPFCTPLLPSAYAIPRLWSEWIASASPLYPVMYAKPTTSGWGANHYWGSFLITQGMCWAAMALVTWRLSSLWQDRPATDSLWRRLGRWRRRGRRSSAASPALRRRLLGINPFFWLGSRQQVSAPVFMVLTVVLVVVAVTLLAPTMTRALGRQAVAPLAGFVLAWMFLGMTLHALLLYYAAMAASHRLAEDKEVGALELILSTPITERTLLRGLWLAYGRRLFFPVIAVCLVHLFFLWAGAATFLVESPTDLPAGITTGQLLWAALWDSPVRGTRIDWHYAYVLRLFLLALALLATQWVTLGWVGRWLGLRLKRPGFAPLTSLVLVTCPPWVVFALGCYAMGRWGWLQLPERRLLPLLLWGAFLLAMAHCLVMSWWAAGHLRRDLRAIALSRFLPPPPRRWLPRLKSVGRFALGCVTVLALFALLGLGLYAYQGWRSQRAWAAFQSALQKRGESIALAPLLPGPVPDDRNLARAPVFQALLQQSITNQAIPPVLRGRVLNVLQESPYYSRPLPSVAWPNLAFAQLGDWTAAEAIGRTETNLSVRSRQAENLLADLAPSASLLANLEAEAARPWFQCSTGLTASAVLGDNAAGLRKLEELHYLLALRSSALLALNRTPPAAADLLTSLRLANLARQSPDRKAGAIVRFMACRSLQPLWEGLVDHRWSDDHLHDFQTQLARFNLLSDHTNALHRVALAQIELWQQSHIAIDTGRPPPGLLRRRLLPRGWWRDQSIQLYESVRTRMGRVDAAAGRMTMDNHEDWNDFSGLEVDGDTSIALQPQVYWWGSSPGCVPYAQTAVNQAILACALERFRLAHGAYPEAAAELIPAFLNNIPTDVARGRPLAYERLSGERYLIRSVGPDQQDDRVGKGSDDWLWQFPTNAPAQVGQ